MYDLVRGGFKREVYRDTSPYWIESIGRLGPREEVAILSCKGRPDVAYWTARVDVREGRPDWGAEVGVHYFVVLLGEFIG